MFTMQTFANRANIKISHLLVDVKAQVVTLRRGRPGTAYDNYEPQHSRDHISTGCMFENIYI